jgi:hypothetical protein
MSSFKFLIPEVRDGAPQDWLRVWASRYPPDYDPMEYGDLIQIAKGKSLSAKDFERIGKWKDNANSENRWRPHVASVAYQIWMQATEELPKCPDGEESGVAAFLNDWSGRAYTDLYKNRRLEKHFGVSRATTLLHFVSGGRFPIFDSRVPAMARPAFRATHRSRLSAKKSSVLRK